DEVYSYQLRLLGNIGELSYEISTDKAAPWLSLDENGLLSGTPLSRDTIKITLTVNDDIGPRKQEFQLIVYAEPLTITSTPIETATTEFLYEYQLTRTGGGVFSLATNEDADWLSLSEDGLLSGTPSEEQNLEVSIILSRNEDTVFQEWTLEVKYKLDILSKPVTKAHEGKNYSYQLYYNGIGNFSVAADPKAEWLSIDEKGLISGTPPAPDTIHVTITAQNDITTEVQEFDLEIAKALKFTSKPIKEVYIDQQYNYQIEYEGIGDLELSTNKEAPWLTLSKDGLLSGTPTEADKINVKLKFFNEVTTLYQVFDLNILEPNGFQEHQSSKLNFYPNPTTDILFIHGAQTGMEIELLNLMGTRIKTIFIKSQIQEVKLSQLSDGIYILKYGSRASLISKN
nr:T9SS type A sorting domain-containing protein [Bacteroidales bacterium]